MEHSKYESRFYFNCSKEKLAEACSEISEGFYLGDPSSHVHNKAIPKVIAELEKYVVLEVVMDASYPYLKYKWLDKYAFTI